jgi:tetratricopeptide (TPR) repeat protein
MAAMLFTASARLHAQVRRAIPVYPANQGATPTPTPLSEDNYQNPAWMNRLPAATPTPSPTPRGKIKVMRAIPVVKPTPASAATPIPTPASPPPPVSPEAPESAPMRPQAPAPDATPVVDTGAPAAAPEAPDAQKQLDFANSLYSRKMYDLATAEYEKFLVSFPDASGRDMALFRLGECHRMLGNEAPARDSYEKLVTEFKTGEFAGAGAYRLAEILFSEKLYDAALTQFRNAIANTQDPQVRLAAKYYAARCLDYLGRTQEAIGLYNDVAAVAQDNPYHDFALMAVAQAEASGGQKQEALKAFETISRDSTKADMRAEATVKAAALAAELGDKENAAALFERAAKMPDIGDWKTAAVMGAMRLDYALGKYEKVAAIAPEAVAELSSDSQAEADLLIADSERQLGNYRAALAAYDRLEQNFPDTDFARDARFHRLVAMSALNDSSLGKEIDSFLAESTDPRERAQAELLKAETLFAAKNYTEAAKVYRSLFETDLPDKYKADVLYKLGWSLMAAKDYDNALDAYGKFVQSFPDDPRVPSVIAQCGLAHQQKKEYDAALQDFSLLIEKYPQSKERETALQQKALLQGQKGDYKGMTDTFQTLLSDYPKTAAAAQANYWIGWAAFDSKDYKTAVEYLDKARRLDPAQNGDRAALRIILAYYYLKDADNLAAEASKFKNNLPPEIAVWLGQKMYEAGNYEKAANWLGSLLKGSADSSQVSPDIWLQLAQADAKLGRSSEAAQAAGKYLDNGRDPAGRSQALILRGNALLDTGNADEAQKDANDALLLQPEGRLNGLARILLGRIQMAHKDYASATQIFKTVALLYDDPEITPLALQLEAQALERDGNDADAEKARQDLRQRYPDYHKSSGGGSGDGQ